VEMRKDSAKSGNVGMSVIVFFSKHMTIPLQPVLLQYRDYII